MSEHIVIALNRQYGCGGKEIGTKLAERLGIKLYDNDIIDLVAERTGIRKDYFEKVDEKPTDSFLYALAMNTFSVNSNMNPFDHTLSSDRLFNKQAEVIKELAKEESFILIGRCGEYILRDMAQCISIYLCADMDYRVERISKMFNQTEKQAIRDINASDKKRDSYYSYYAGKDWKACTSYDLSIDTSAIGIDNAVDLIEHYTKLRMKIQG